MIDHKIFSIQKCKSIGVPFLIVILFNFCLINEGRTQTYAWAKSLGGNGSEAGYDIAIDAQGNIYTTGFFYDTCDFDPGLGTFTLTSNGGSNCYISKLNANGDFVWAKPI